jgi:hypothetical protein
MEFALTCAIDAQNAFRHNAYHEPTDADRAIVNPYVDKGAALLEAHSASSPDRSSQLLLQKADLLASAARWEPALAEIRRVTAMPEFDVARAMNIWTVLGRDRGRPAVILEACRTLGPRLPEYDFAMYAFCVENGAAGDPVAGLTWATDANRARFKTDEAEWKERQKREDALFNRNMERDSCKNRCVRRYDSCLSHGSECTEAKENCLALCRVRYGS